MTLQDILIVLHDTDFEVSTRHDGRLVINNDVVIVMAAGNARLRWWDGLHIEDCSTAQEVVGLLRALFEF